MAGLGLLWIAATRSKAVRSNGGNDLFLFAARRKIPAQALALKKYRSGSLPPSRMSNNEDAAAALGHSEELSVQNSVSDPVPEVSQRPQHGSKRPSPVDRQDARDVFPNNPARSKPRSQPEIFQREVAARVIHSKPPSSDGEGLARGSSHENINCPCSGLDLREVAKVRHLREAMRQNSARKRVDLREPPRAPAESFPGDGCRFNSGANGPVDHLRPRFGRGL